MAIEYYLYQRVKRSVQLCLCMLVFMLGLSGCKSSTNAGYSATGESRIDSKQRCLDPDLSFSNISLTSFAQSDYASASMELCRNDRSCTAVERSCLVCPDAWFISFVRKEPIVIPADDPTQGVCVPTHMLGQTNLKQQRALYASIRACLLKDGSDNIITADVDRTRALLPLWKRALRERVAITQAYFNQHICIDRTEVYQNREENTLWFNVYYSLNVDWAKIETVDQVGLPEQEALKTDSVIQKFRLELTHPINKIVSRSKADALLKTCHNSLSIENMRYKSMDHQGRLRIVVWQKTEDTPKQQKPHYRSKHNARYHNVWRAELDLESGKIERCAQVSKVVD